VGCILHISRHLLFVSAGVDNFLLSGGFEVVTVKGMGEVSKTKGFELIIRNVMSCKI
jgi:hypothetical protein